MEIKAGDYLITNEKELYRIMEVHKTIGTVYYDIKSMTGHSEYRRNIFSIPRNVLRHMGKIIPEELTTKTLKILYG